MDNKLKVINFLQDFGCAKLEHLQKLFGKKNNNFKSILNSNMVSKKGDIFVHNTKSIDNKILIALDILCKYKNRLSNYRLGYEPAVITFLTKENILYHIIVADKENKKGMVKLINSFYDSIQEADKLILVFPDELELEDIKCKIDFLYCTYPGYEILNSE